MFSILKFGVVLPDAKGLQLLEEVQRGAFRSLICNTKLHSQELKILSHLKGSQYLRGLPAAELRMQHQRRATPSGKDRKLLIRK